MKSSKCHSLVSLIFPQSCGNVTDCAYYSFDSTLGVCLLTDDCPSTTECLSDDCVHGDGTCEVEPDEAVTTASTMPTTTGMRNYVNSFN